MPGFAVLSYNRTEGDGTVRFLPAYQDLVRSERLDALLDWIAALQDEYDTILNTPPALDGRGVPAQSDR